MGIKIKNTPFKIRNAKIKGGSISGAVAAPPEPAIGEIVRVINVDGVGASTYNYTDLNGNTQNINLNPGAIEYLLVLSGSVSDSWDISSRLAAIRLLITGSELGNAFTEQLITTTGAGTWTKPVGVTQVIVECWGGGGAGGGAQTVDSGGGGGAGGSYSRKLITYTSPSANKSYSIAASVTGTTGNGANGNDTTWETNVVIAKGGEGGLIDNFSVYALAQPGSIGDIIYEAEQGGIAFNARGTIISGQGGFGANSTGTNATAQEEYGGAGGSSLNSVDTGQGPGLAGSNYGGGGGGGLKLSGANKSGGNGAQGLIRLIYR